jgi:hypothetical protein
MAWRDKFKVHPSAAVFPMMPEAQRAKLQEDIKANGLKQKIVVWRGNGEEWLIDGRNRLEAMDRAAIELEPAKHIRYVEGGDPVALVISLNVRRRHLTKKEQAYLIVRAMKAAPKAKANGVSCQPDMKQVSKRGRPKGRKPDPEKQAIITIGKAHGLSSSTMERARKREAEETEEQKAPKERRTDAEIEREKFERLIDHIDFTPELWAPSDAALALLSEEKRIFAVEILVQRQERVTKLIERLRSKSVKAA